MAVISQDPLAHNCKQSHVQCTSVFLNLIEEQAQISLEDIKIKKTENWLMPRSCHIRFIAIKRYSNLNSVQANIQVIITTGKRIFLEINNTEVPKNQKQTWTFQVCCPKRGDRLWTDSLACPSRSLVGEVQPSGWNDSLLYKLAAVSHLPSLPRPVYFVFNLFR